MELSVPKEMWGSFDDALEKLTRSAEKARHHFSVTYVETYRNAGTAEIISVDYFHLHRDYTIQSNLPDTNTKYELLGSLDHLSSDNATVVTPLPGMVIPQTYFADDGGCDHCRTKRNRRTTYILKSESGQLSRVGSSCLNGFVGKDAARLLHWQWQLSNFLVNGLKSAETGVRFYRIEDVLALSVAVVRARGFVPVSKSNGTSTSTKGDVDHLLHDDVPEGWSADDVVAVQLKRTSAGFTGDREKGQNILDWAASLDPSNNYLLKLREFSRREFVPPQSFALLVSSVHHYEETSSRKISKMAGERVNKPAGEKGDELTVEATVLRIHPSSIGNNKTYLYTLRDTGGHSLKWFSNIPPLYDAGEHISLQCTIKRHDEYHGMVSTVVSVTEHSLVAARNS